MINQAINQMLSDVAHPFIHLAGTAHGVLEYFGRSFGVL
ncbi:hypothetical protein PMI40_04505 [Herbaspirillum sp. YR522]|nr:hypothetical protein PMI40_04505 [Herbaspirillum sp. YR522]